MVYIILGTGFEEIEAIAPCDILRRGGVEVRFAGIGGRDITGGNGITVRADCTVEEMDLENLELIMLPGGMGGVTTVRGSKASMDALRFAWENGKFVAAICAGPTVLADMGIPDGKNATCYPGLEGQMGSAHMVPDAAVVRDGMLITGTAAGCSIPFGLALVAALKGQETADTVAGEIVIR